MPVAAETIHLERDFPLRPDQVIAHWTSPITRARWETAPDSEMIYDTFDCRPGGREIVRIVRNGQELGQLRQHIQVVGETQFVSLTQGVFGGQVAMLMQIALDAIPTSEGCVLKVTTQIMDMTGRDEVDREHRTGWSWIMGRFAADIKAFGPIIA